MPRWTTTPPKDLVALYQGLHQHPELSFAEHRNSASVAVRLNRFGYEVTTGVVRTGVLGLLRNGVGPTVLLRADMDGLPVREGTGLLRQHGARRGPGRPRRPGDARVQADSQWSPTPTPSPGSVALGQSIAAAFATIMAIPAPT